MDLKVDKRNGSVCFNEEAHVYWDEKSPGKFISVTTLIEKFAPPFDKDFWSKYKALERLIPKENWKIERKSLLETHKYHPEILDIYEITELDFNKEVQNILDEWEATNKESCDRGTKIHLNLENSLYGGGKSVSLAKYGVGGTFECRKGYNTLDLENGVYPEYLISYTTKDGLLKIAGQIDCLVKQGNTIHILDWKGLPLDTKIPTPNGFTTMGEIEKGDELFDENGDITKVIHKSSVHHNPCFKINFDNGDSIIADCDHRWKISFRKEKGKYSNTVMTTKEIYNYLKVYNKTSYTIPRILNPKPLNINNKDLLIDPYVLGVWLGDGSKDCGIITQVANSKIWNEIKKRGYDIGDNVNHSDDRSNVEMRTIYGLRTLLKKLGLLNNKYIPNEYLRSNYNQRLDLLRGLMDTDGYYNPKRKRFVMSTSQEWQRDDLVKLLGSLGLKSSVFSVIKKLNNKEFQTWDVCFSTTGLNPFLTRNQDIVFPRTDKCSFRNIISVEKVETVPTQCIEVDSPTHTFLCTEKHIVTHNTNKELKFKGGFDTKTKQTVKMNYPLNTLEECNFSHYTMQLSTYAWMIQKLNPDYEIGVLKIVHFDHNDNMNVYEVDYKKKEVERMLKYYKRELMKEEANARINPIVY